jgi:hypothetical protein
LGHARAARIHHIPLACNTAASKPASLDLLTTEQSLVAIDAAVAVSDTALVQDQIAVFKALGGGWHAKR